MHVAPARQPPAGPATPRAPSTPCAAVTTGQSATLDRVGSSAAELPSIREGKAGEADEAAAAGDAAAAAAAAPGEPRTLARGVSDVNREAELESLEAALGLAKHSATVHTRPLRGRA